VKQAPDAAFRTCIGFAARLFKASPRDLLWRWGWGQMIETLKGVGESMGGGDGQGAAAIEIADMMNGEV
jgi:hypothetical protein